MLRSSRLPRTEGLGTAATIVMGFAFAALVAIAFSEGVLPVDGSAAQLGGEGYAWSLLR